MECLRVGKISSDCLDSNNTEYILEKANDADGISIIFERKFQKVDFLDWQTKRFTGFSVQWVYLHNNDDTKADKNLRIYSKNFQRMANYLHKSNNLTNKTLWNYVKLQKAYWMAAISDPKSSGYGSNSYLSKTVEDMYDDIFKEIGPKINQTPWTTALYADDISDETLKTAAEMFLYIMAPQQEYWVKWHSKFSEWMEHSSLRRVLGLYFV